MANTDHHGAPPVRLDMRLLARLLKMQKLALMVVVFVAGIGLLAWFVPQLGQCLPASWHLMKANTAVNILLAAAALAIAQFGRGSQWQFLNKIFAVLILFVAASAIWAYSGRPPTGLETLLAADTASQFPGRMSLQAAIYFLILGPTLFLVRPRDKNLAYLVDALSLILAGVTLVMLAGYCFGAEYLFAETLATRVAPHTLLCMVLLTFVRVGQRSDRSIFSVFVGVGIGSRTARLFLPFAIIVPYLLVLLRAVVTDAGVLTPQYAAAMTASITALFLLSLVTWMAWRINDLERELRDMSLTDELTQIYNRRGFYFLGEQSLREAHRTRSPLTTLFFDLDGLKQINDLNGHEVGSKFLQDFAKLLRANFRGADILGRVGGDEFAVVMYGSNPDASRVAMQRLSDAAAVVNKQHDRLYDISYSVGQAVSDPLGKESFTDLLRRADTAMYSSKNEKKLSNTQH